MDATIEDIGVARQRLEVSRQRAERKLAELRGKRGASLIDGKPFDNSKITIAEDVLASHDEAIEEAARRDAVLIAESGRAAYDEAIAAYVAGIAKRVDAVGRLEVATRALGVALAAALEANADERLAASHLGGNPEADLTPVNFQARLWGMMRGVLRASVGTSRFGPLDLAPFPGDLDPKASWSEAEAARGTMLAHFRRLAPK